MNAPNAEFAINLSHISHETQNYLQSNLDAKPNHQWESMTSAIHLYPNDTNDGYIIEVNASCFHKRLGSDIPSDLASCMHLSLDFGHTIFELNATARRFQYLPWYDYNTPTETTPAHSVEYCYCGNKLMYCRNLM